METGLIDVFTVTPLVSLDLGKKHEKMRTGMTSGNHTLFCIHINTYYICKRFKGSSSPWVADKDPSVQGNNEFLGWLFG